MIDVPPVEPAVGATAALPYGPRLTRLLRPVQRGFLFVNRWIAGPMLRSPLGRFVGNPFTAYLLLLRTRGRRTGLVREAPLGYVLLDGFVYCVAGYGVATPWYRNLVDNPTVEVVLPGRTIRGVAEPVTDDAEWLRGYRTLIAGFGLVGRLVDGDPRRMDDATLLRVLPAQLADVLRQVNGFILHGGAFHLRGACSGPLWHSLRAARGATVRARSESWGSLGIDRIGGRGPVPASRLASRP